MKMTIPELKPNSVVLIGDVHGYTETYQKFIRRLPPGQPTIQIGDMAMGFSGVGLHRMPDCHTWFRGNHDNPAKCRENPNYRGDWGYDEKTGIFHLAGAWSADHHSRVEGVTWWRDEELNWHDLNTAVELYRAVKPRFVVSHECPSKASQTLIGNLILLSDYSQMKLECGRSRTATAMQAMLESHQPEKWAFGHYHMDHQFYVHGYDTQFIAIGGMMAPGDVPHTYVLEF